MDLKDALKEASHVGLYTPLPSPPARRVLVTFVDGETREYEAHGVQVYDGGALGLVQQVGQQPFTTYIFAPGTWLHTENTVPTPAQIEAYQEEATMFMREQQELQQRVASVGNLSGKGLGGPGSSRGMLTN